MPSSLPQSNMSRGMRLSAPVIRSTVAPEIPSFMIKNVGRVESAFPSSPLCSTSKFHFIPSALPIWTIGPVASKQYACIIAIISVPTSAGR